jgi:hypothetical protein
LVFSSLCKVINSNAKPIDIIKDSSYLIGKRIKVIEDKLEESKVPKQILNSKFKPTKTCQNALNFISKDDFEKLNNLFFNDEEMIKIYRLISILIGKTDILSENIIENQFNKIFEVCGVDNISKLLL